MGELKFISKKHLGSGNFEWTYECTCVPRPVKKIKVASGNELEAKQLAEQECDEYCNTSL